MSIHVRTWPGSSTARITDMTNAGKRGKQCSVLRFSGAPWSPRLSGLNSEQDKAAEWTQAICGRIERLNGESYEEAAATITGMVAEARADGVPATYVDCHEEEIKGIHAPKARLSHGTAAWSISADENGISLSDLTDEYNEPAMITIEQSRPRAYEIAKKCWAELVNAKSMSEAADILTGEGARLHYYCRVD